MCTVLSNITAMWATCCTAKQGIRAAKTESGREKCRVASVSHVVSLFFIEARNDIITVGYERNDLRDQGHIRAMADRYSRRNIILQDIPELVGVESEELYFRNYQLCFFLSNLSPILYTSPFQNRSIRILIGLIAYDLTMLITFKIVFTGIIIS